MRPALYGAFHRVQKIGKNDGKTLKYDITGRICENTDRISKDHNMPTINEEELCAIMDSGAYGYSMSHNFNTRPRPAEVLIDEEKLIFNDTIFACSTLSKYSSATIRVLQCQLCSARKG